MNTAIPTVAGPTINVNPLGQFTGVVQTAEIPKVANVADASRYPGKAGTQDVLLCSNDPEIAYFRLIDANGFVQVDRRRCIAEPEPTQEQINDSKYLSRKEFTDFMNEFRSFREEMNSNVRVLTATNQTTDDTAADESYGKHNTNASGSKVSVSINKERNRS